MPTTMIAIKIIAPIMIYLVLNLITRLLVKNLGKGDLNSSQIMLFLIASLRELNPVLAITQLLEVS
jgi:hypothetical protein